MDNPDSGLSELVKLLYPPPLDLRGELPSPPPPCACPPFAKTGRLIWLYVCTQAPPLFFLKGTCSPPPPQKNPGSAPGASLIRAGAVAGLQFRQLVPQAKRKFWGRRNQVSFKNKWKMTAVTWNNFFRVRNGHCSDRPLSMVSVTQVLLVRLSKLWDLRQLCFGHIVPWILKGLFANNSCKQGQWLHGKWSVSKVKG